MADAVFEPGQRVWVRMRSGKWIPRIIVRRYTLSPDWYDTADIPPKKRAGMAEVRNIRPRGDETEYANG